MTAPADQDLPTWEEMRAFVAEANRHLCELNDLVEEVADDRDAWRRKAKRAAGEAVLANAEAERARKEATQARAERDTARKKVKDLEARARQYRSHLARGVDQSTGREAELEEERDQFQRQFEAVQSTVAELRRDLRQAERQRDTAVELLSRGALVLRTWVRGEPHKALRELTQAHGKSAVGRWLGEVTDEAGAVQLAEHQVHELTWRIAELRLRASGAGGGDVG